MNCSTLKIYCNQYIIEMWGWDGGKNKKSNKSEKFAQCGCLSKSGSVSKRA